MSIDYLGFIGFCVGLGWIPVVIIIGIVFYAWDKCLKN